jgi:cellulase
MASLPRLAAGLLPLAMLARSQQIGSMVPEVHPKLPTFMCTKADGCVERSTSLVTDALSRPFHLVSDPSVSCSTPLELTTMPMPMAAATSDNVSATACASPESCAQACALEGIEYGSIGVLTSGSALTLRQYLFDGQEYRRVSPRVYLLAEDQMNYEMMQLVNKEFTYDVDLSQLVCGMNGALYLSEMEKSGSRSETNPAGAAYGTGYCDAQCFNVPWINGLVCVPAYPQPHQQKKGQKLD